MWAHGACQDSATGKFLCQETPTCAKRLPQQTMIWTASKMPVRVLVSFWVLDLRNLHLMEPVVAGLGSRIQIHIRIHANLRSDPVTEGEKHG